MKFLDKFIERIEKKRIKNYIEKVHKIYKLKKGENYIISIGSIEDKMFPTQQQVDKTANILRESFPSIAFVVSGPDFKSKIIKRKIRKKKK